MKKIFIIIFMICMFIFSFSYAVFVQDNIKYISSERANEIWGIETEFNARSGVIKIFSPESGRTIYMQLGSNGIMERDNFNSFFHDRPPNIS
jgi:hypothetical protein